MAALQWAGGEEGALIERIRQGDRDAAASLMQRHNRALWRVARGILGSDSEAEDVVQETYLRGLTAIQSFRGESSLRTWLARIVVNEAMRRLERRRSTVNVDDLAETLTADQAMHPAAVPMDPEQAAAGSEIRRMVERAIDRLPAPFRAVFMMRVVEQMSVQETAGALDIPAATVKTRLHRANSVLRSALGADLAAAFSDAFPFAGARCRNLVDTVLARLPAPQPTECPAAQCADQHSTRGEISQCSARSWLRWPWFALLPPQLRLPGWITRRRRRRFAR